MDIHRSRFIPYQPSAINALAFSHTEPDNNREDPTCLRLAIGRANGNIEIWNPARGAWLQESVFTGGKDRSVEGLAWIQEPDERDGQGITLPGRLRLFSIGYSSSVTEWNLATGLPSQHSSGNHSEIWCFAAQPKLKTSTKETRVDSRDNQQNLIAGCADGSLVLLSTAEGELRFDRFLSRLTTKRARVLSVTYKDRNTVLAGFADSTIRVFDTRNNNVLRNISLGSGPPGGPKDILIWKVRCFPNGDFVSGDSTGDIRIYDGKNYSQMQRISGHEADVLDLVVSQDGNMIFSGGLDRRTCFYSCKKTGDSRSNRGEKWREVSHKRYHDHDVKAIAIYEGNKLNFIVSGGIDTQPIVVPLREFGKELSRGLPTFPSNPPLVSAPKARLIVSWWNCEVRIWRVKNQQEATERPKVVARLALKGDENITSVAITHDGQLLAVATVREVKLFHLTHSEAHDRSALRIRKLDMPPTKGAKIVRFTADGKWLAIITPTNHVQLARATRSGGTAGRPRILPQLFPLQRLNRSDAQRDSLNGSWGLYNRSIHHAEFSTDGAVFAVVDLAGYIDTWVIQGHDDATALEVNIFDSSSSASAEDELSDDEDTPSKERITMFGQQWIRNPSGHLLPRLDSSAVLISFQPTPAGSTPSEPNGNPAVHQTRQNPHPHSHDIPHAEHHLLVVSAEHHLYHFEVIAGRLSQWSRKNTPASYPSQFRMIDDPAKGCVWDVNETYQRIWLYGEKWLFMFDLSRDLPLQGPSEATCQRKNTDKTSKKRKRDPIKENSKKTNSGAGGAVPESEAPVTKMRRYNGGKGDESAKSNWIDVSGTMGSKTDEEYEDQQHALVELRRSSSLINALAKGHHVSEMESHNVSKDNVNQKGRGHEGWWHTFKYRPILGMVPIAGNHQSLEVVLVERPSWDLDLPPRFTGSHE
ncbi:small nucleolar ribonucleoprotein-like protein complex subunit [Lojkania enalia]|uniref:Small nucleolar ribonucleoprotein-like protein complex subunit n=1 Tax=Lojkania enalia TaxID=147567 RepID=A0A9P4NDI8_9PLEO|nr:small nucleolar ribonucleoprotein-like protein complex subunit [Didymosphaeria enalia]